MIAALYMELISEIPYQVVMDFVKEIESATGRRLASIDIGGGLSSSYTSPEEPGEFTFLKYRKLLDNHVPELFSGKYKIITEFGRSLLLKVHTNLQIKIKICVLIYIGIRSIYFNY